MRRRRPPGVENCLLKRVIRYSPCQCIALCIVQKLGIKCNTSNLLECIHKYIYFHSKILFAKSIYVVAILISAIVDFICFANASTFRLSASRFSYNMLGHQQSVHVMCVYRLSPLNCRNINIPPKCSFALNNKPTWRARKSKMKKKKHRKSKLAIENIENEAESRWSNQTGRLQSRRWDVV